MDKKTLRNKIKQLAPWYQRFKLGDVWTTDRRSSSPRLWNQVTSLLPNDLANLRILDLGCNAGIHCCNASMLGAEVVGINIDGNRRKQAEFVRDYIEKEQNFKLNITYIWKNITEVNYEKLGHFDYVFAFAIIYHIGRDKYELKTKEIYELQKETIGKIKTDSFIVRMRPGPLKNVEHYDRFFNELGFVGTKYLKGAREVVLYERKIIS